MHSDVERSEHAKIEGGTPGRLRSREEGKKRNFRSKDKNARKQRRRWKKGNSK